MLGRRVGIGEILEDFLNIGLHETKKVANGAEVGRGGDEGVGGEGGGGEALGGVLDKAGGKEGHKVPGPVGENGEGWQWDGESIEEWSTIGWWPLGGTVKFVEYDIEECWKEMRKGPQRFYMGTCLK